MPELLDLLPEFHATSFALFPCQYGAASSKPTRFLTNLQSFAKHPPPYAKLPHLDANGHYLGPLPRACPHGGHDGLIGRDPATGKWRTAPSASYPPDLCKLLAQAVADSLMKRGPSYSSSSATAGGPSDNTSSSTAGATPGALPERLSSAQPGISVVQPGATSHGSQGLQPEGLRDAECLEPLCLTPQLSQPKGSELDRDAMRKTPISAKFVGLGFRPPKPLEQDPDQTSDTLPLRPIGFRPDPFSPETRTSQSSPGKTVAHAAMLSAPSGVHPFPPVPPKGIGFSPEPLNSQSQKSMPQTLAPLPAKEAEAFATRLARKEEGLHRSELEALQGLLPLEAAPRDEGEGRASSFVVGAYCKGGLVGLRKNTASFPMVCTVLTSYVEQVKKGFTCSAIALFQGVKTPMHKDSRNAPFPNPVAPIGQFTGEPFGLKTPRVVFSGNTPVGRRLGFDLTVDKGPVTFNAFDSFHFTRAWKGNRLVLVAYTTDRLEALDKQDARRLQELGFRLPVGGGETSEVHQATNASRQPFQPSGRSCAEIGVFHWRWNGKVTLSP